MLSGQEITNTYFKEVDMACKKVSTIRVVRNGTLIEKRKRKDVSFKTTSSFDSEAIARAFYNKELRRKKHG